MELTRSLMRGLGTEATGFVALGAVAIASVQAGPLLVSAVVDATLAGGALWFAALCAVGYLLVNVLGGFLSAWQNRVAARMSERVVDRLRTRLFSQALRVDAMGRAGETEGSFISRLTSDVEIIAIFLRTGVVMTVGNLLVVAVTTVFMFTLSPILSVVILVCVAPVAIFGTRSFLRHAGKVNDELRSAIAVATAELNEGIHGIAVVRRFGRSVDQIRRYVSRDDHRLDAAGRSFDVSARYSAVIDALGVLVYLPVLFGGALLLHSGLISVGEVVGFTLYVGTFFEPVQSLTHVVTQAQAARSAFSRAAWLASVETGASREVTLPVGELRLEKVEFRYSPEAPAAMTVGELRLEPGARLGLVGPSGAGKTTLARLLSGALHPQLGQVAYADHDLADVGLDSVRRRIVSVWQEGHVFAGSVRDNLGLSGATSDRVEAMLQQLVALGLPEGVGEKKDPKLSAGQRQLICLGRALLLDPAVLILDEATADMDARTARGVDALLATQPEDRTIVVIAHRISTAARMAQVAVIDEGRVVQHGRPRDLEQVDGLYRDLVLASQGVS
ncbi:MAG: ABC transporter ATP-binding protein/permease [Propionibacteriaceae bacterium]|jgi:ATP-binding cassette subfamily B protein|nr:ABC transporter ATP-binding protein/permease [Propionibacteriaceae bacterium]